METAIIVVHIMVALAIIGLILLQQGKGADAGASFGSGASQTLFGSRGSGNALSRGTGLLVAAFFVTSVTLAVMAKHHAQQSGQVDIPVVQQEQPAAPAAPAGDVPVVPAAPAAPAGDVPPAK